MRCPTQGSVQLSKVNKSQIKCLISPTSHCLQTSPQIIKTDENPLLYLFFPSLVNSSTIVAQTVRLDAFCLGSSRSRSQDKDLCESFFFFPRKQDQETLGEGRGSELRKGRQPIKGSLSNRLPTGQMESSVTGELWEAMEDTHLRVLCPPG